MPTPDWRFENFNSQNHFISREMGGLTIDKFGYVWVCSSGVQRFDGYKTIDFNSFAQTEGALRDNYTDIITDNNGRVWVSSAGLCYYDDTSGKFIYAKPDPKYNITYAYAFFVQKKYLWFVCDYGLAKLDLDTLKITFTSLTNVKDPLCTYLVDEHTLLISSRETVYAYNIKKDTYVSKTLIYNHSLLKIFAAAGSGPTIFLGTNMGLFALKNVLDISLVSEATKEIAVSDMAFLPQDKQKKYLFLGTEGRGIMVFNTISKKIDVSYVHNDNNPYSLPNNIVNRLFADKKGKLWISTDLGISMLDVFNQQLKMRFLNKNNASEIDINKIAGDKYDSTKVWMSSYNQGLVCMNWKTKEIEKIYKTNPGMQKIYDFMQLSKDRWLLVTQKEIMEWGPQTGILYLKKLPVPDSLSLVYNIRKIIAADASTYFITTNRGLFKYDLVTHQISVASENKGANKINDPLKYDLLNGFYDKGLLWIASRNGLFNYDIATGKTTIYRGKGDDHDYFFFDVANAVNNQVVCAARNGIAIFNKQSKSFKVINSIANLFNPYCVSVVSINDIVWIGSEAGLLNYDLETHKSARAEHETSLMQVSLTSPVSIIRNDIVAGFRNGYAYFTPDLKNLLIPSDPVIERVYVNNKPVLRPYPKQKNNPQLVFSYSDNSINMAFTAFLYTDPDHINFRYRLKGADAGWHYAQGQRSANYAQLQPDNYTFYVQSGNNGIWNNHLASFSFIINPPYWETWWFRALVVLVTALILYRLYLYKIGNIKAIESIRQSIASDFHDDLGSTLSSISIFSEVAIQKAETDLSTTKNMVGDIGMRARAMIHSLNDMVWTIKPENDNLYRLMQRMEEFGYPVAEAKEIQLVFLMDESLYDIKTSMLSRKNLFLMFKEAFNNAVKYSGADGIEVRFHLKQKKELMMQITDNGCGFEYKNKSQGNGLGNMQKRAAEIKGKLIVTTTPGGGTSIDIICKIT